MVNVDKYTIHDIHGSYGCVSKPNRRWKKGVEDLFDWEAIAKETNVTTEVTVLGAP